MILGRAQAAHFNVLVDCWNHGLIQPEEQAEYRKILTIQRQNLDREVEPQHQADIERRDQLQQDWKPKAILRKDARLPSTWIQSIGPSSTWKRDQDRRNKNMDRELQGKTQPGNNRPESRVVGQRPSTIQKINIDIYGISGEAFQTNLRRKENTFFSTSLYKINQIIKEKEQDRQLEEQ